MLKYNLKCEQFDMCSKQITTLYRAPTPAPHKIKPDSGYSSKFGGRCRAKLFSERAQLAEPQKHLHVLSHRQRVRLTPWARVHQFCPGTRYSYHKNRLVLPIFEYPFNSLNCLLNSATRRRLRPPESVYKWRGGGARHRLPQTT